MTTKYGLLLCMLVLCPIFIYMLYCYWTTTHTHKHMPTCKHVHTRVQCTTHTESDILTSTQRDSHTIADQFQYLMEQKTNKQTNNKPHAHDALFYCVFSSTKIHWIERKLCSFLSAIYAGPFVAAPFATIILPYVCITKKIC